MFNSIFSDSLSAGAADSVDVIQFIICILVSLILGAMIAGVYTLKNNKYTQSFLMTLIMLPAVVCVVIMMVNGNIGAGIAVVGVFGLVRFRSIPGTAREIAAIFLAMGTGLIAAMGYIAFAILFVAIMCIVMFLCNSQAAKAEAVKSKEKLLKITIPESLDYEGVFDEVLASYTDKHELVNVKTTAMGSLFKLTYLIKLSEGASEKEFIDNLRTRNGNLEVSISRKEDNLLEL